MDKLTLNQLIRARGGKVFTLDEKTSCYEIKGTEKNEIWFYAMRDKIGFNNMLMKSTPIIQFNVYWDQLQKGENDIGEYKEFVKKFLAVYFDGARDEDIASLAVIAIKLQNK
jgi:hypothetical protein